MTSQKTDIHQDITNQIITLLERVDIDDYQPPFANLAAQGLPENPTTGNQYRGVNILSLWFNQEVKSFTSNEWASFNQWKAAGANVRKGEKGSRIIFYKTLNKIKKDENGKEQDYKVPLLRYYTVFNANQVDNYNYIDASLPSQIDRVRRIDLVDEFCKGTDADIRGNKNGAYYNPKKDCINMPPTNTFLDTKNASASENYYSTLLHELTHWTGAPSRLNRDWDDIATNQTTYAFEELIAELGAAFLCAQYGIAQTLAPDHAIYIKSWLMALKNDNSHIFKAAAQAQKAVEYLNELNVEARSYETIV